MIIKKQYYWGYLAVLLSLLLTYAIYFGSMWFYDDWYDYRLKYLAKLGSMGTTMLMCWALLLAARLRVVNRLFGGMDKVYKAHHKFGEAALYFIFLHPIFLALNPEFDFFRFFWIAQLPGEAGHYYLSRMTGLAALAALVGLTLLSLWFSLPYHHWKQTHNFFGLVLVLVIFHAVVAQGEIMSYPVLEAWFAVWAGVGVCCYFYIRVLYRWFGPIHDYLVDHIRSLGDITEVHLRPRDPDRKMAFQPGQFLYVYFESSDLRAEPHPFSISSAPQAGNIRISVKKMGDWTEQLPVLKQGQRASVWGPYGKFGDHMAEHAEKEIVMLAGGIGITPFLSMVENEDFRAGKYNKAYLFYSVNESEEAYYHDEITELGLREEHLHYIPHSSDSEGYLTLEDIEDRVGGDLKARVYLICGPKMMMDSLREQLMEAGVPVEQIFTEDFSII
jgi:predicted ferric reductase